MGVEILGPQGQIPWRIVVSSVVLEVLIMALCGVVSFIYTNPKDRVPPQDQSLQTHFV